MNEWNYKTLIDTTFFILIIVFIDRFIWKMSDWVLIVVFFMIVGYVLWDMSVREGFVTGDILKDTGSREWKTWEWTPTYWNGSIPNPDGGSFPENDWFVGIGGFNMPCSHYADGYTCRTYIRDGVWWYEAHGHGSCWANKIIFIAIPRKYVQVYTWYQGW